MKACITCKEIVSKDDFFADSRRTDGLMSECKSCGRKRNQKWYDDNSKAKLRSVQVTMRRRRERPEHEMLVRARYRARLKGMDFDLEPEDVVIPETCPVLGIPLVSHLGLQGPGQAGKSNSPALDRIDNMKGYVKGNVKVVSHRANRLKSDATIEEIEALHNFYVVRHGS